MKAGPKHMPTALKILTGNRGKDPLPKNEPQFPVDMPTPPEFIAGYALEEWHRVTPYLYSVGILTQVDRAAIAAYCQCYGRWRMAEERFVESAKNDPVSGGILARTKAGNVIQNPILSAANAALRDMIRIAAEFGMTPSARARIEGKRGEEQDTLSKKYGIA